MRGPASDAARRTLALWRDAPKRARLHTTLRWWSAPFEELARAVPSTGRILEVGCGHGLLSTFLALDSPDRSVVGIDVDDRKIELARSVIAKAPDAPVAFERRSPGDIPTIDGGWDAIVIADVLYLLGEHERLALVAACLDALAPAGEMIIKEVDTRPRLKALLAHAQEFVATRVLRITHGDHLAFVSTNELELLLDGLDLRTTARRLDHGYFHPHCLVTGVRRVRTA